MIVTLIKEVLSDILATYSSMCRTLDSEPMQSAINQISNIELPVKPELESLTAKHLTIDHLLYH